VPYQYIRNKVDVRLTETTVEIYYNHSRIASHRRLYGKPGQYKTVTEHMPPEHQEFLEWNGDRFRRWAKQLGPNTYEVINAILASGRVEQQTYSACMGLLKMASRYSDRKLEAACEKALSYTSQPSYKGVKNILMNMKDEPPKEAGPSNEYGITRGARYYGGNKQ